MNAPAQNLVMERSPAPGDTLATAETLAAARDAGLVPQVVWQPLDAWLAAALGQGDEPLAAVTAWREAATHLATAGATLTPAAPSTDPVLSALGQMLATAARGVWPDLTTLETALGTPHPATDMAPFAGPARLAEAAAAAWTDTVASANSLTREAALLRGEMVTLLQDADAAAARTEAVRTLRAKLAESNRLRADMAKDHAAALAEHKAEISRLSKRAAELESRLSDATAREKNLRASTSWRVTAPLRAASGLLRRGG